MHVCGSIRRFRAADRPREQAVFDRTSLPSYLFCIIIHATMKRARRQELTRAEDAICRANAHGAVAADQQVTPAEATSGFGTFETFRLALGMSACLEDRKSLARDHNDANDPERHGLVWYEGSWWSANRADYEIQERTYLCGRHVS
jgi:hypothetical protein